MPVPFFLAIHRERSSDDLKTLKQGDNMSRALKGERILRSM